jgi:PAS domain-containing protein
VHHQFFGEIVNYRSDGSDYPVELQIVPVSDAGGSLRYRLALHRDISRTRHTESELREREFWFRNLLGNMRDIIVCHGESGGGPHGYRDGAVLLGRDAQRIAGTLRGDKANIELWYRSIHPDDRAAYLEAERRRKERDESYTLEYRIMHRRRASCAGCRRPAGRSSCSNATAATSTATSSTSPSGSGRRRCWPGRTASSR